MSRSKLLFGVRAQESVRLTVTTSPSPASPPPLTLRSQHGGTVTVPFANGRWEVALDKGDHLVQLAVEPAAWFDSPLQCAFSAPVKFVIPEDIDEGTLKGWTTSVGIANDPKNPWPPPSINAAACDTPAATWLSQGFAAQAESIWLERS